MTGECYQLNGFYKISIFQSFTHSHDKRPGPQGFCISSGAKHGSREMDHKLFLMAWFLESLQQCNHWTFQSTWSHSWHVLTEGSNKMPPTCIIRQHRKLLYKQNPRHESKLWQLHSDGEELHKIFSLSSLLPDIIVMIWVWTWTSFVLLRECVICQGTRQQLCYRSNPEGSIHWVALGDPWQHTVVWLWQTNRKLSANCLHPCICFRTENPVTVAFSLSSFASEMNCCYYFAAI